MLPYYSLLYCLSWLLVSLSLFAQIQCTILLNLYPVHIHLYPFLPLAASILRVADVVAHAFLHCEKPLQHRLPVFIQRILERFLFHPREAMLEYIACTGGTTARVTHRRMQRGSFDLGVVCRAVKNIVIIENGLSGLKVM